MNLLTQRTQLETDLATIDQSVMRVGRALHRAVMQLKYEHARFWGVPDERLLAVLNHDVARTIAVFTANTTIGAALNAALDQLSLPDLPERAPVEYGRADVVFDQQTGQFGIVPLPEPEAPSDV